MHIHLQNRALLSIKGSDARTFLQGIITNDINKISAENAIYTCLLTPQGKFLFDFFVAEMDGVLVIDCDSSRKDELKKRLLMYKLRSNVEIEDISGKYKVVAILSDGKIENGISYKDPRDLRMGARAVIPASDKTQGGDIAEYEKLRISLAIPDGAKDLEPEGTFPLHNRMDELNAIDFEKGCYVGQEVTTRSKHRGNIRRTLYTVESPVPLNSGAEIKTADGKLAGKITSSIGGLGIAMLEKEYVESHVPLLCGDIAIRVK